MQFFLWKSSNTRCKSDVIQQDKNVKEMRFKAVSGNLGWKMFFIQQHKFIKAIIEATIIVVEPNWVNLNFFSRKF